VLVVGGSRIVLFELGSHGVALVGDVPAVASPELPLGIVRTTTP
jgi:hypothetical protein